MAAAEVQAARDEKRLHEYPDKTGFMLPSAPPTSDKPVVQKLIDGSESLAEMETKPEPDLFAAMKETLKAGVQVISAPQLFPTPPDLAARVVELAEVEPGHLVLEPSAGTGAIVRELAKIDTETVAIEINAGLCSTLEKLFPSYRVNVRCLDFLTCNGELGQFDRIVMNPPFVNGADIKHIEHARGMLKPGGRLVAICANGPRQRARLMPETVQWIDLEPGSFDTAGTNVNAAICVMEAH